MISALTGFVQEQLDEWAHDRYRKTLLNKDGIPLSVALLLANESAPRTSVFRRSLGEQGYRDWSRLRFCSQGAWDRDEQNFGKLLAPLVMTTREDNVELDIREIRNIALSRDELSKYQTIEQFADDMHRVGQQDSASELEKLLAHLNSTCMSEAVTASNVFAKFGWDDRILFDNDDGSHRLAAARRIAIALGKKVSLKRPLEHHFLNAEAVQVIADNYVLLLLPNETWINRLPGALFDADVAFVPGAFRAPPCYGDDAQVLPLLRNDDRSASAARYLRSCGFTDLVDHLIEDLGVQQARTDRLN